MYRDDRQWADIRRRILEKGMPKKQVARESGISRRTINKMLRHEHPPGYGPRPPNYRKLGPYISAIDRRLHDTVSSPLAPDLTIQGIVGYLRREENFTGSYDSVWNYLRRRARDDENTWERVYDLIVRLPKPVPSTSSSSYREVRHQFLCLLGCAPLYARPNAPAYRRAARTGN
jgi:transposase